MKKRLFLIFALVVSLMIFGVIRFIQSASFAQLVKTVAQQKGWGELGIAGDFRSLEMRFFPPGLSVLDPEIRLTGKNVAGIPAGSHLKAKRLDLDFRPVQIFSGNIRIHEVSVVDGSLEWVSPPLEDLLAADRKKKKEPTEKFQLRWDHLFQIRAENISLRQLSVNVRFESKTPQKNMKPASVYIEHLRLGQWQEGGELGYFLAGSWKDFRFPLWAGVKLMPSVFKEAEGAEGLESLLEKLEFDLKINSKRIEILHLGIKALGSDWKVEGQADGNVVDPQSLKGRMQSTVKLDLNEVQTRLNSGSVKGLRVDLTRSLLAHTLRGQLTLEAEVAAEGADFKNSIQAKLRAQGQDLQLDQWVAQSFEAKLSAEALGKNGEFKFSLQQLEISHPKSERINARISGRHGKSKGTPELGGRVEVLPMTWTTRLQGGVPELEARIKLEDVAFQWLAAPTLEATFGLRFRASGEARLKIQPTEDQKSWEILGDTRLQVPRLILDNQHRDDPAPDLKILDVPKISVQGGFVLDPKGIRPQGLSVKTGSTVFEGSGRVDFKNGLDLRFDGIPQLEEIGEIAGIPIRGTGPLVVLVQGIAPRIFVHFDPQLKNGEYLGLKLGDIQGRITLDADPGVLYFTGMKGQLNSSQYSGEGVIHLAPRRSTSSAHENGKLDFKIRVAPAKAQDVIPVFDSLTRGISWFPRSLNGELEGDVQISGDLAPGQLMIAVEVTGKDWNYWGERFTSAKLKGGYFKGKFELSDYDLKKRFGTIRGSVFYDPTITPSAPDLKWKLVSQGLQVEDFDHLTRFDIPVKGQVVIESSGSGKMGAIESKSSGLIQQLSVRGIAMPNSSLKMVSEKGKLSASGFALGNQANLDLLHDFKDGNQSSVRIELNDLDFSPAVLLVNSKLSQDRTLKARAKGLVELQYKTGAFDQADGMLRFDDYLLEKKGTRFSLEQPASAIIQDGSFNLSGVRLKGGEGSSVLSLLSEKGNLEGWITGTLDASILEFATSVVSGASGLFSLDFAMGGALDSPTFFGRSTFKDLILRTPSLESPIENLSGTLQVKQNTVTLQNAQADLAGGKVTAEGQVTLFSDQVPHIDLNAKVDESKLKIFPFQFIKLRGGVRLHGESIPYQIDGNMWIDSALSREKIFTQKKGEGPRSLQYAPPPTSVQNREVSLFRLNIDAQADRGVVIQNELFDLEARGKFKIVNTLELPRVLGNAELISGRLNFKERAFQIQSASAVFDNPTAMNPSFTLNASTDVGGTKVLLYAHGKLDQQKIELTSNPAMSESDILSLLAIGAPVGEESRFGEAASLLLHSLDFNREVQNRTGLQIQLDESSLSQQQGSSVFRPQSSTDGTTQPKLVIRRQIGKKLGLAYSTTVGGTTNGFEQEVNAEYRFTPGFSVQGVWNYFENSNAKERTSLGLDLKFETRFR